MFFNPKFICFLWCANCIFDEASLIVQLEPTARLFSSQSEAVVEGSPIHVQLGIDGIPSQTGIELCIGFKRNYDFNSFEASPLIDSLRCENELTWWNGSTLVFPLKTEMYLT